MNAKSKLITLVALASLLFTTPVLAAAVYSGTLTVKSTTTTFPMVPVIAALPTTQMITDKYITATGLDAWVERSGTAVPTMLADDKVLFAVPLTVSEPPTMALRTGNTPLSNFYIIPGYNGYVTTTDHADLEPGGTFNITLKGYIDTSAAMINSDIFLKTGALRLYVQAAGNLRASFTYATGTATVDKACTTGLHTIIVSADTANFTLSVDGAAATATQTVAGAPADTTLTLNGAGDYTQLATLFGAATHWEAVDTNDTDTSYVADGAGSPGTNAKDVYAVDDWVLGSVSSINHVHVYFRFKRGTGADVAYARGIVRLSGSETIGAGNNDATGTYAIASDLFNTKPGGGSWTTTDISNMQAGIQLYVDTPPDTSRATWVYVEVNYTPWVVASIVNTANNWVWGSNATPYFEYISLTQNVTPRIHYHPATYILTTVLPNITTPGSYQGAFTFGTNPAGVTATLDDFLPVNPSAGPGSSAIDQWELITDPLPVPTNLYGELDMTFFGAGWCTAFATATGIPIALPVFIYAFGLSLILGLIAFRLTMGAKGNIKGSLLVQALVSLVIMVYFTMAGAGVIPAWVLLPFAVEALVSIIWRNTYNPWN